jgi:hypothetical protein
MRRSPVDWSRADKLAAAREFASTNAPQSSAFRTCAFRLDIAAMVAKPQPKRQVQPRFNRHLGQLFGGLADFGSQSSGKLLEILAQHFRLAQVFLKHVTAIEIPERSLQAKPVKGVKNPHDILLVPLYKWVKDAAAWSR